MENPKTFLGTGWSFPPIFDEQRNTLKMVTAEEDIRQSLIILLSTTPGERPVKPKYGCDLKSILFEPIGGSTNFLIKDMIRTAVLFYEPRVDIDDIEIDKSAADEGVVGITLHYTVRSTNIRSNIVFPFYKTEGTIVTDIQ
ncbi:MAG: GPW/gp25 family protein [Bacteroidota bacterium]